jgi:hypothetical protein
VTDEVAARIYVRFVTNGGPGLHGGEATQHYAARCAQAAYDYAEALEKERLKREQARSRTRGTP